MDAETVVDVLFKRFPELESDYETKFPYMEKEQLGAYIVFGSVLIPALERALATGDLSHVVPFCAFLEEVAEAAQKDSDMASLLGIEVGEWLGGVENEEVLTPWLGTETKRICRYVPGLATQRLALRKLQNERSFGRRISSLIKRLSSK